MVAYGKVLLAVKRNVVSFLSSTGGSDGIRMSEFVSNYHQHIGRPLDYDNLGYTNLHEFISAIPDVARIKRSEVDPNSMVVAMAEKKMFSKNGNAGLLPFPREACSRRNVPFGPDIEALEPDHLGRFSLCLPIDQLPPDVHNEEIQEEFSTAADVIGIHRTASLVFIRFGCKEELKNCLTNFSHKYNLKIGKNKHNRDGWTSNHRRDGDDDDQSGPPRNQRQNHQRVSSNNSSEGRSGGTDRHRGGNKFNHQKLNGHDGPNPQLAEKHDMQDCEESSTEVFASNIESEDDFKTAIQTYNPKDVKLVVKDRVKYAFVEMWNHEDSLAMIRDLDNRMQATRRLSVKFKRPRNESQSDHSLSESNSGSTIAHKRGGQNNSGPRNKTRENGRVDSDMPELEMEDCAGMPALVHETDVNDPDGMYDLDCSVLVTNFPPRTMESQLRTVFKNYRVLDICVLNNGYPGGCTKALLYMSTINEAIKAVTDTNEFMLDDYRIKVIPPLENVLLKKILVRMETGLREWS